MDLEGDDPSDRPGDYEFEDEEHGRVCVWAAVTVPAGYFSGPACHLVLDRYELIEQAGLPMTFEVIDDEPRRFRKNRITATASTRQRAGSRPALRMTR